MKRATLTADSLSHVEFPLATQCAWCRRVKTEDGRWVENESIILASHGICPRCLAVEMAKLALIRRATVAS